MLLFFFLSLSVCVCVTYIKPSIHFFFKIETNCLFFFPAERFGVKELLPAYLSPNLQPQELPTGVSFASGGSGYDPLTAKLMVWFWFIEFCFSYKRINVSYLILFFPLK